jgi:hypothetical protein
MSSLLFCSRLPGVHLLNRNRHHAEVAVVILLVQPREVGPAEEVERVDQADSADESR